MKKILLFILITTTLSSCKKDATFIKLSGAIKNPNASEFQLFDLESGTQLKSFAIDATGKFSDTITLEKGRYYLSDGVKNILLYLTPGTDLSLTFDTKDLDNTLHFEGQGQEINSYILEKMKKQNKLVSDSESFFALSPEDFNTKIQSLETEFFDLAKVQKNIDPEYKTLDSTDTKGFLGYIEDLYFNNLEISKMIGQPSPEFENYENFKGGKTSLKDLKGKYVYIDVWATWCKPCVSEIPSLIELESIYGDRIHFVSISVDEPESREKWKAMIQEKGMKGIQLFANQGEQSPFDIAYKINSIPRFILLDPNGIIVKPDAPRPSSSKTKELFDNLLNKK